MGACPVVSGTLSLWITARLRIYFCSLTALLGVIFALQGGVHILQKEVFNKNK